MDTFELISSARKEKTKKKMKCCEEGERLGQKVRLAASVAMSPPPILRADTDASFQLDG